MSDQNEKLSSLMDDYRQTDQDLSVLDELQGDVNQQYTLQRYQLIGNVMRNELPDRIRVDFAAAVRTELEKEPVHNQSVNQAAEPRHESAGFWSMFFKPVAGLAVAATVAVATISSLQSPSTPRDQSTAVASSNSSQTRIEQLAQIPPVSKAQRVSSNPAKAIHDKGMVWKIKRSEPEMQSKLNAFLVNHNEYSNSMNGIIPQSRVVGFDGQK